MGKDRQNMRTFIYEVYASLNVHENYAKGACADCTLQLVPVQMILFNVVCLFMQKYPAKCLLYMLLCLRSSNTTWQN